MSAVRGSRRACVAALCAWLVAVAGQEAQAAPPGAVAIAGDVKHELVVDAEALRAYPADAQVSFRAERQINGQPQQGSVVKGVRLIALLEQAGLAARDRNDWRRTVVVAIARDGYRAVFSWPELSNTAGGAQAMVGYERDGAPLADGPLVVLAPADTRTGPRHVKLLQRIEVRILRD